LLDFAKSFLDPERNGYSVSAHIRDQARIALGKQLVETETRAPVCLPIVGLVWSFAE